MHARRLEFDNDQQRALLFAGEKVCRAVAFEEEMACDEHIGLLSADGIPCKADDFEEEMTCDDWMQEAYDAQTCANFLAGLEFEERYAHEVLQQVHQSVHMQRAQTSVQNDASSHLGDSEFAHWLSESNISNITSMREMFKVYKV